MKPASVDLGGGGDHIYIYIYIYMVHVPVTEDWTGVVDKKAGVDHGV